MAAIPGNNSMIPSDNVVMGVPKKGRLYDRCMKLLAGAGMDHRRVSGSGTPAVPLASGARLWLGAYVGMYVRGNRDTGM